MQGIRAVLLDIDNTLLDFERCSMLAIEKSFAAWRLPLSERVFPIFREINDALWLQLEKEAITREALYQIRWTSIFDRLGISADGVRFDECFRRYITEIAVPIEGAHALLQYLAPKYTLCAASNSTRTRQTTRLKKADMLSYFDFIFTSSEIGHPKPEKAFFNACLTSLGGLAPEECVIIGDSLSADIAGGAGAGMPTIWFNFFNAPLPACPVYDFVVSALSEIQSLL